MSAWSASVFRRAAEILRERGHCKGIIEDPAGRVCAAGALREALRERDVEWCTEPSKIMFRALESALLAISPDAPPVPCWNDEEDRTATEVEKLFLLAADEADVAS